MRDLDAFAQLGMPRQASMEEGSLRLAYVAHSRTAHPDHGGSEDQASAVNAAYETLKVPEKRLKHLLELVAPSGSVAWRTVPLDESMTDLFMALGAALNSSASTLAKKERASTALARAVLAGEVLHQREELERLGFLMEEKRVEMEQSLPALDARLAAPDEGTWQELAAIQARFAYLAKWHAQVRERLLALM